VRVLIAPDCFTGTLSAAQAADAIAEGWRRSAPDDDLTLQPLSDGGPGFLDVLTAALSGATVSVTVSDPLRRPVPAAILMVDRGVTRTAYIESAQACGLHLLSEGERNPMVTSTYGVGELIDAAVGGGATRVVVGLGGSGTNDGGAGMLAALGAGDRTALGFGGAALGELAADALEGLRLVRERLRSVELVLATDVDSPLLGLQGASAVYAAQKGATPEMAQQLEAALGHFTEVVGRGVLVSRDLLTGKEIRLEREPGAGAAGGLGYGLLLLGGHRVSGVQAVLDAVGFEALVQTADLVITGEGRSDVQTTMGKAPAGVARVARERGVPVVCLAGGLGDGAERLQDQWIDALASTVPRPMSLEECMARAAELVESGAARVCRLLRVGMKLRPPGAG